MNDENQKLIEALRVIQDTCNKQHSCESCPMSGGPDTCLVNNDAPVNWVIVGTTKFHALL